MTTGYKTSRNTIYKSEPYVNQVVELIAAVSTGYNWNEPIQHEWSKNPNLLFCWDTFWQTCTDEKTVSKDSNRSISRNLPLQISPYHCNVTLDLFRRSARKCIVLTHYTVYSGSHQQTFDQQKWLYCWCQFLSYCRLIVFNKGSIGTNYMGLRLGIDNALCLMMCEKLWLCLCVCVHIYAFERRGRQFSVMSCMWACLFPLLFFKWVRFSTSILHDGQL